MSTARKRRAFKPPTDSDDDIPTYIDDQEQDALISNLRSTDTSTTTFYQRILLIVPFFALLPYFFPHLVPSTTPTTTSSSSWWSLSSTCVITVLLSAYILVGVPLPGPELRWTDMLGMVPSTGDSLVGRVGLFNAMAVVMSAFRGYILEARGQGSWLLGLIPLSTLLLRLNKEKEEGFANLAYSCVLLRDTRTSSITAGRC
jgi:hypothetical protein